MAILVMTMMLLAKMSSNPIYDQPTRLSEMCTKGKTLWVRHLFFSPLKYLSANQISGHFNLREVGYYPHVSGRLPKPYKKDRWYTSVGIQSAPFILQTSHPLNCLSAIQLIRIYIHLMMGKIFKLVLIASQSFKGLSAHQLPGYPGRRQPCRCFHFCDFPCLLRSYSMIKFWSLFVCWWKKDNNCCVFA